MLRLFSFLMRNKNISIFLYEPSFVLGPYFLKRCCGSWYMSIQRIIVIHYDEILSKFVERNNMNAIP